MFVLVFAAQLAHFSLLEAPKCFECKGFTALCSMLWILTLTCVWSCINHIKLFQFNACSGGKPQPPSILAGQVYVQLLHPPMEVDGEFQILDEAGGSGKVRVDIRRPTPPEAPFIVRYEAWDVAGNAADVKLRWVHIECSEVRARK